MFQDGQRLGEFEILGRLGQGGMGAVYKARQVSLNRFVALKTLQASLASDPEYIARFRREAMAAASLNHPNLVQVHSAGETDGLHWFAMEYVEGESAESRVKRKERLDATEALAIGIHVATALEYGWRKAQLIHRDIKPDNIFLSSDGEVKLGDLGLAKSVNETQSLTMTGSSMGTPHYVSPEQAEGKKDVDLRADIYSLGCTLYHLLTGKPPYSGDTAMAVMLKHINSPVANIRAALPGCPEPVARAVTKMMAKQPTARQQTYADVLADLRRAYDALTSATVPQVAAVTQQAGQPPPAARPAPAKAAAPHSKSRIQNSKLLAVIAAGVLVLGIGAFFIFGKKKPQLSEAERADLARAAKPAAVTPSPTPQVSKSSATPAAATKDEPFVNSLGMKFVPVPIGGGSTKGQRVLFGVWHVRVADYATYAKAQESAGKKVDGEWKTQSRDGVPAGREVDHPVVGVSLEDAQAFCKWLTEKESAEGKLPRGLKYRLPSDEEWSWAVGLPPELAGTPAGKGGKNSVDFPWGKDYPSTKKVGNYADESYHAKFPKDARDKGKDAPWMKDYTDGYATTSPVGSFPANAYGLYDMGGNVWQWCEDWFDKDQKDRALRGASWDNHDSGHLLSSYRYHGAPGHRRSGYGFRCVLGESAPEFSPGVVATPPAPPATPTAPPPSTKPGNEIAAATKDAPFVNSLGMKFVPVPIGGGPTAGQRVLFGVWVTRVQDYAAFAEAQESAGRQVDGTWKTTGKDNVPAGREPDHPVVGVNWDDAQAFCQWLTAKENADGKLPQGMKYRLPSDEEWSWAVGLPAELGSTPAEKNGKNSVDFPWGRNWPPPRKVGNYADEAFHSKFPKGTDKAKDQPWIEGYNDGYATTSPVGSFPANTCGLYDMGGNVWQWCAEWIDEKQSGRIARGGTWDNADRHMLRSAQRSAFVPGYRLNGVGFRIVLAPVAGTGQAAIAPSTPVPPPSSAELPAWIRPELPPPGADGWITIFDGKELRGARISPAHVENKSIQLQNDTLVLNGIKFNVLLPHGDVAVRFTARNDTGDANIDIRRSKEKSPRYYHSNFGARGQDVGIYAHNPDQLWLNSAKTNFDFKKFFVGEIQAIGTTLNLLVGDRTITSTKDNKHASGEFIAISAPSGGRVYFKRIEVKVLSPGAGAAPSLPSANPTAPPPSTGSRNEIATATKDAPFINTLGMNFVPVPIGGGPTKGQRVLFGVWHVRVADYAAYAKAQESAGKNVDGSWKTQQRDGQPAGRELDHPAVGVSWEDGQAFCKWLTEKESAEGKLPRGLKYRLPSDEEWSWAVGLPPELAGTPAKKGGKNSVDFPWGKDYPPTKKVGNYADESYHAKFPKDARDKGKDAPWMKDYTDGYATTSPVGSFPANAYGLYDMGGNVWQWCEDWFDKDQKDRVLRGASWGNFDRGNLLSSYRYHHAPGTRYSLIGFRCVVGESAR